MLPASNCWYPEVIDTRRDFTSWNQYYLHLEPQVVEDGQLVPGHAESMQKEIAKANRKHWTNWMSHSEHDGDQPGNLSTKWKQGKEHRARKGNNI